jgi:hypothetical protein
MAVLELNIAVARWLIFMYPDHEGTFYMYSCNFCYE